MKVINNKIFFISIILNLVLLGNTIHISPLGYDEEFTEPGVPFGDGTEEFPFLTIQKGINTSVINDTVLVADGIYQENIVLDKSIVLTSYAIYDDLTDWIIYDDVFTESWVINNDHISNTHINGGNPDNIAYGSAILITPMLEECIQPQIIGFTIEDGIGTEVVRTSDIDEDGFFESTIVRLGGGILADISNPIIHYNQFRNNGSSTTYTGGAIQLTSSTEDWSFNDTFLNTTIRCEIDTYQLTNNLYDNNDAFYGNSLGNKYHENEFDMSESIFDILNCGGGSDNLMSSVWVSVEPNATVDYSGSEGNACGVTSSNVYVDSNIEEYCNDDDCGSEQNPFKTINRALETILPTEDNPITLYLAAGTYSVDSGELFPIVIESNILIVGDDFETTIIDAQGASFVIILNGQNITIDNVSIINGEFDNQGALGAGGINILGVENNNILISNSSIRDNYGYHTGGVYIESCLDNNGSVEFNSITINNNNSTTGPSALSIGDGGSSCNLTFDNVVITENSTLNAAINLNPSISTLRGLEVYYNDNAIGIPSEGQTSSFLENLFYGPSYSSGLVISLDRTTFDSDYPSSIYMNSSLYPGKDIYISCTDNSTNTPIYLNTFSVLSPTPYVTNYLSQYRGGAKNSSNTSYLYDYDASFPVNELVGEVIENLTDGSSGIITANDESTIYAELTGGNDNSWYYNDDYRISLSYQCNPDFTINNSIIEQTTDTIYVSVNGNDLNDGLSFETAIKTIERAKYSILYENDQLPVIFLDEGIFSTSTTGELFPIVFVDNCIVMGSGSSTIINAEDQSRVGMINGLNNFTLSDMTLTNGDNVYRGGGLKVVNSTINLNDLTINYCRANYGGGLYLEYYCDVTSNNLTLKNNYADNDGGGLMLYFTNMYELENNHDWGVEYWSEFNNIIVEDNSAPYGGGGIMLRDARADFNNIIIRDNNSNQAGGGALALHRNSKTIINRGLIIDNSVYWGQGNILLQGTGADKELILINTTIAGNTSSNYVTGGGIVNSDGHPILLLNSILQNNSAAQNGNQFIGGGMNIYYSNTTTVAGLGGNINSDPLFSNANYELSPNSPCIEAGTSYFEWNGVTVLDLEPDDYDGNAPNMGYHQCVLDDCGVCNGNNTTMDCLGECGGPAIVDDCGICDGGNSSCAEIILSLTQTGDSNFNLNMDNSLEVSGFQIGLFDTPDYYEFSDITLSERVPTDWNASGSDVENIMTLLGFTFSNSTINPGTGTIANIDLINQSNTNFETELCFEYSIIASPDASELISTNFCEIFSFPFQENPMLGDLNEDQYLNILDIVLLINLILENGDYIEVADVNNDNNINILDIVQLVNLILNT